MLTIAGLVLVAAGILAFPFYWRTSLGSYIAALLVVLGTGLQVYETWSKLPPQCRSRAGALSCMIPASADAKGKRR
jgi:hypothetical protein